MEEDYDKIKTRFVSNVNLEQLIDSDEAGYIVHKLFYEYERFVFSRFVIFEKTSNKTPDDKTLLAKMLPFYNASLRKTYNLYSVVSESDIRVSVHNFMKRDVSKRIVMIEKADKNMPPVYSYKTSEPIEGVFEKNYLNTDISEIIKGYYPDIKTEEIVKQYSNLKNVDF
jgi:hypothetical protein